MCSTGGAYMPQHKDLSSPSSAPRETSVNMFLNCIEQRSTKHVPTLICNGTTRFAVVRNKFQCGIMLKGGAEGSVIVLCGCGARCVHFIHHFICVMSCVTFVNQWLNLYTLDGAACNRVCMLAFEVCMCRIHNLPVCKHLNMVMCFN